MPITMEDIRQQREARKLFEDAKAEKKAVSIINAQALEHQQQATISAQQASEMGNQEQVTDIIKQMEMMHSNGQDPMQLLDQLQPELRDQVENVLQSHSNTDDESAEPTPDDEYAEGQMNPQATEVAQQRASDPQNPITAQARSIVQGV